MHKFTAVMSNISPQIVHLHQKAILDTLTRCFAHRPRWGHSPQPPFMARAKRWPWDRPPDFPS